MKFAPLLLCLIGCAGVAASTDSVASGATPDVNSAFERDQPIEIGTVRWLRDLDEALAAARARKAPILLFFQEVPG